MCEFIEYKARQEPRPTALACPNPHFSFAPQPRPRSRRPVSGSRTLAPLCRCSPNPTSCPLHPCGSVNEQDMRGTPAHTCMRHVRTRMHTPKHMCTHMHMHACTRTRRHAHALARAHVNNHAHGPCIRARMSTHTCASQAHQPRACPNLRGRCLRRPRRRRGCPRPRSSLRMPPRSAPESPPRSCHTAASLAPACPPSMPARTAVPCHATSPNRIHLATYGCCSCHPAAQPASHHHARAWHTVATHVPASPTKLPSSPPRTGAARRRARAAPMRLRGKK